MKHYKFTIRETGQSMGPASRHEFPDFCAGMTKEQRDEVFIVEEIEE